MPGNGLDLHCKSQQRPGELDILTITVMLIAALMHASWHALVKSGEDQITVLAGMGLVSSAVAVIAVPFVPLPSMPAWPVMMASVALHVGYKLCLASAYARGDLGQAFPLARGLVPLFATALALVALGQVPTIGQLVGIGCVSIGVLLLATERIGTRLNWRLMATTAGAGAAVAFYSVLDAFGTRSSGNWAGFAAWLIILDNLFFLAVSRVIKGPEVWSVLHRMRTRVLVSGLLGLVSFTVFLWALSRNPVGPVAALRESSLLFAVVIGMVRYGEGGSSRRIEAALAILAGFVVIAMC